MGISSYSPHDFESYFPNMTTHLSEYQKSAPFTRHRFYLPALYGVLFIIGVLGNVWVVYVIACIRWMACGWRHPQTSSSTASTTPVTNHPRPVGVRRQCSYYQMCVHRLTPSHILSRLSRTSRNVQVYIICLCCCDLVVLLFLLFLISDLVSGQWPFRSTFLCRMYLASESVNKFCVPFLLVALSGYCYTTVAECDGPSSSSIRKRPSLPHTGTPSKSRAGYCHRLTFKSPLISAFCSLCAGFSLVIPVYLYSDIRYFVSTNDTSRDIRWVMSKCAFHPPDFIFTIFTLYSFFFGYVLPSILFTCFYTSVFCVVYRRTKRSSAEHHSRIPRTHRLTSVAKTTLGIVFFYQLCWTPYWSMILYQYIYGNTEYSAFGVELAYFVHVLPYINCTGYPIVYTLMNKNIKEAYQRIREVKRMARQQYDQDHPTDRSIFHRLWIYLQERLCSYKKSHHPHQTSHRPVSSTMTLSGRETEMETLNYQKEEQGSC